MSLIKPISHPKAGMLKVFMMLSGTQVHASGRSLLSLSAINLGAWIAIVALSAAAMVFAYTWSESKGYDYLDNASEHKLELYVTALESELAKHEYLPSTLELDDNILGLLQAPSDGRLLQKVNKQLAILNVRAGSVAIFVLNTKGRVLASSDWYQAGTVVGTDFSMLPYVPEALLGAQARYFSPNLGSKSPEYYFVRPIRANDRVLGIAVVKTSLDPIETTWAASLANSHNEIFLVIDENDTIIMASTPDWRYKKTTLLPEMVKAKLSAGSPHSAMIPPFNMVIERKLPHGKFLVSVPLTNSAAKNLQYMTQGRNVVRTGWRIVTLSDVDEILLNARYMAIGAGTLAAFAGLLGMYLIQRRRAILSQLDARKALQQAHDELGIRSRALQEAHDDLERRVVERTAELHKTNNDLMREIVERKRTEQILREAQDELVQASKLALLGQMSAGITHEINQPLTALRSLSHNTQLYLKRGNIDRIDKNLQAIKELTERMARITEQLKSFSRKAPLTIGPVLLTRAIDNVLLLLENRIRTEQIHVQVDISESLRVLCDGNRLEQVLINLCANALDAMQETPSKILRIKVWTIPGSAMVQIIDSGSGIPEEVRRRLFEPFFSTKPAGKGLGLGLAISAGIVREFGGVMRALNVVDGAAFEFDLKLLEEYGNV